VILVTVSVYDGRIPSTERAALCNLTGQIRDMRTRILRVGRNAEIGWTCPLLPRAGRFGSAATVSRNKGPGAACRSDSWPKHRCAIGLSAATFQPARALYIHLRFRAGPLALRQISSSAGACSPFHCLAERWDSAELLHHA